MKSLFLTLIMMVFPSQQQNIISLDQINTKYFFNNITCNQLYKVNLNFDLKKNKEYQIISIINDAQSTNVVFKPEYDSENLNEVFKHSTFSKTYLDKNVKGGGNGRMTLDKFDYYNKQENKF